MFENYLDLILTSQQEEVKVKEKFKKLREDLSLKLKNKLLGEIEVLNTNNLLSNYSPIKHHNEMTELVKEYNDSIENEKLEIEKINLKMKNSLLSIINK